MMNNAIGLIETRGLVASIEALDAALKAANVILVKKEFTKGGWVMITFEGDVGAVSVAVDAGAAAAAKVGDVISAHVIPRLSQEVWGIVEKQDKCSKIKEINLSGEDLAVDDEIPPTVVKTKVAPKSNPQKYVTFKNKNYAIFDKGGIDQLKVVQLRQLARQLNLTTIDRGMIKFANKSELIKAIREHHKGGDLK